MKNVLSEFCVILMWFKIYQDEILQEFMEEHSKEKIRVDKKKIINSLSIFIPLLWLKNI